MKKIVTWLFALTLLLSYTSCQEHSYIENDLHGLWQVTTVEDKTTGALTQAQGELYYSFQRNMVIVGYKSPNKPVGTMMTQYISDFYLSEDSIEISPFRIYLEYDKKAPLEALKKFGIHDEHTTFAIDRPNKEGMILESEKARITLRKY